MRLKSNHTLSRIQETAFPMTNYSAITMIFKPLFLVVFLTCFQSCAAYKIDTRLYLDEYPHPISSEAACRKKNQIASIEHPLYNVIPRHRDQIRWYDLGHWFTWMLLGNDDDGIFGEGSHAHYKIDLPPTNWKALAWGSRNPLHNFCFYVIGSAYRENSEFTLAKLSKKECVFFKYIPASGTLFPDKDTSFFLGFHGWKPFISARVVYNAKYEGILYAGWRERGNFGLKFLPFTHRKLRKSTL
jgi:hypothetical protein